MSFQIVKPMLLKMLILAEDQITSLLLSWLNRWNSAITQLKSRHPKGIKLPSLAEEEKLLINQLHKSSQKCLKE